MHEHLSRRSPSEHTRDDDGTRAGPARERDPAAALPGAHRNFAFVKDLRPVAIRPSGKRRMILHRRADAIQIERLHVRRENNDMRIAHRNECCGNQFVPLRE